MTLEADQAVQEARFAGACQDQHAGRPAPSWGGLAKGNQSSRNKCRFLIKVTGWGPGAWGPGLGAGPQAPWVVKKSPGGRQAKGWETVETAAAEVGAWRQAGTGYPPYPAPGPPPRF